jgi:hypothetical protein
MRNALPFIRTNVLCSLTGVVGLWGMAGRLASAQPTLRGLDSNATYTLTNLDIAGATEMTRR